jgi:hypothetical protein
MSSRICSFLLSAFVLMTPSLAESQNTLPTFAVPLSVTVATQNQTLFNIPIQGCDGITDKYSALNTSNGLPPTNAAIFVGGGTCVISNNITLSKTVTFAPGGEFKPQNGVRVAFTGTVNAGQYQICDTSAGGHCDFTGAHITGMPVEWLGVNGGDTTFNPAHASANKRTIDEILRYGSYHIYWATPGIYSTTCHQITYPHHHVGLGRSFKSGAVHVLNGIEGSGCPATDAAHMGSDLSATAKYVFQSGPVGSYPDDTVFDSISIGAQDPLTTIPIGVLWSTVANNQSHVILKECGLSGLYGIHFTWANANTIMGCSLNGLEGGFAATIPPRTRTNVQKVWVSNSVISQTPNTPTSGSCVYEANAGSADAMEQIHFTDTTVENCYDGYKIAAQVQVFSSVHTERVRNKVIVPEVTSRSYWVYPSAAGGNSVNQILGELSCQDGMILDGGVQVSAAGACLVMTVTGTGSPNGSVYAGSGSVYYRRDASGITQTPCFQLSAVPANSGWVNNAGKPC